MWDKNKTLEEKREDNTYDGEECTCTEECKQPCKGVCGCPACGAAYGDFLSMPDY